MRELWRRIRALGRRGGVDEDLDEELRFHLEMKARELGDADAAHRAVGNTLRLRERAWDAWGWQWLDELLGDVRGALRQFRRSPGFTAVVLVTLALGIGVNGAVFTIANSLLFSGGFPQIDPENRIVYINSSGMVSYPDFEDWRSQATSFEDMAVVSSGGLRYRLSDRPGSSDAYDVTQLSFNAFRVLHQQPVLGRDFVAADEAAGAPPVAILSYALWQRRYNGDPAIVGRLVRINDRPTTIVGVMPPGVAFPHSRVDLWLPLEATPSLAQRETRRLYFAFGRLAPGATLASARAEMAAIGRGLALAYPGTNHDITPKVWSFREFYVGSDALTIYGSMWGAVGFVLLIACANVANLLLARSATRSREISVRMALGAGRWRVVRQLLIENVLLATTGGVLGGVLTTWGVRLYQLFVNPPDPYMRWEYVVDMRVIAYLALLSLVTGVLVGLAPARRLATQDVNATLKDGGRGTSSGRGARRLSATLVIAETALALVLLAGAGLLMRSFLNYYGGDIGIDPDNLLSASAARPASASTDPDEQIAFFDRLVAHVAALPGVSSVALASSPPTTPLRRYGYELAGLPPVDDQSRPTVQASVASPGYFSTIGARLLAGREFDGTDQRLGEQVAIVNERFADTAWPGEDPLGKRVRLFDGLAPGPWRRVVGVASNVGQTGRRQFDPLVYVPFRQEPDNHVSLILHTTVPPHGLADTLRRDLQQYDDTLTLASGFGFVSYPAPLTDAVLFQSWPRAVNGGLFLLFATLALLLASLGLYAVVAHAVSQRTQEIGVRTALGATTRDIVVLVIGQGMRPVGIGLVVGLVAALGVTPLLRSQLVGVSPMDPLTLAGAAAALLGAAALGCWLPARQATRVDPVVALRHD